MRGNKIYVAMSGGVDSSTSAALLKSTGNDVTGVFIKAWYPPFLDCGWKEEEQDAMRVCAQISIPFETFNFEDEYKKKVIDHTISEYRKGRTPNPDVLCNQIIKFGLFFEKAMSLGADYIATGHYAQTKKHDNYTALLKGYDKNKDQSYFLWTATQDYLPNVLFPIGGMEKQDVRKKAKKFGIPVAEKKDSQGLCFLGKLDFKAFLKKHIDILEGEIIDIAGNAIGVHDGAAFYTIGERHGFIIHKKKPHDKPYYIVDKNIKRNTLVVAQDMEEKNFHKKEIFLENINWISGSEPDMSKMYSARIRYRQPLEECRLECKGKSYVVLFNKPQRAVASGQSLVLYLHDECIGGGIIK